jgi:hypothetical protein
VVRQIRPEYLADLGDIARRIGGICNVSGYSTPGKIEFTAGAARNRERRQAGICDRGLKFPGAEICLSLTIIGKIHYPRATAVSPELYWEAPGLRS